MGFDETILEAICDRENKIEKPAEIPFHPTRVLMQDFTGVPAIVDLAALRNAVPMQTRSSMINPTFLSM